MFTKLQFVSLALRTFLSRVFLTESRKPNVLTMLNGRRSTQFQDGTRECVRLVLSWHCIYCLSCVIKPRILRALHLFKMFSRSLNSRACAADEILLLLLLLRSQGGETALMCAADGGHAECVRLLLEAGADKVASAPSVRRSSQCLVCSETEKITCRVFVMRFMNTYVATG